MLPAVGSFTVCGIVQIDGVVDDLLLQLQLDCLEIPTPSRGVLQAC